jgi:hypothetical protein
MVEAKCLENLCIHTQWIMSFPDDENNSFPKVWMQIDDSEHKMISWYLISLKDPSLIWTMDVWQQNFNVRTFMEFQMLKRFKDHISECVCISVGKKQEKKCIGTVHLLTQSPHVLYSITLCLIYFEPLVHGQGILMYMLGLLYCFFLCHIIIDHYCVLLVKLHRCKSQYVLVHLVNNCYDYV